jgi:integrator complex subunit 11
VLIPVFALGRAQELCILLETYWQQNGLNFPIYFSAGLAHKANDFYRLFVGWTNEKIRTTYETERNMFEFAHIKEFDLNVHGSTGPMVLFATPGMLHGGMSLEVSSFYLLDLPQYK